MSSAAPWTLYQNSTPPAVQPPQAGPWLDYASTTPSPSQAPDDETKKLLERQNQTIAGGPGALQEAQEGAPHGFWATAGGMVSGVADFTRKLFDPRVPVIGNTHYDHATGKVNIDPESLLGTVTSGLPEQEQLAKEYWARPGFASKVEAAGHELASYIPFLGPMAATAGVQAGNKDIGGALLSVPASILAAKGVSKAPDAAMRAEDLLTAKKSALQASDAIREAGKDVTSAHIENSLRNMKTHAGEMMDKIESKDRAVNAMGGKEGAIPLEDIAKAIDTAEEVLNRGKQPMSKVGAVEKNIEAHANSFLDTEAASLEAVKSGEQGAILKRIYPPISFRAARSLRTFIGEMQSKAANSKEYGILSSAYDALTKKLQDRAKTLGELQNFTDSNAIYKTYKTYLEDPQNVIHKLISAPDGKTFFDAINQHSALLRRAEADLSKYGLPKGFFDATAKRFNTFHDFLNRHQKGENVFQGMYRSVLKHPVAGGAGLLAGRALGSALPIPGMGWLGGIAGAITMGKLADKMKIAREIRESGGAPPIEGRLAGIDENRRPVTPTGNATIGQHLAYKAGQTAGRAKRGLAGDERGFVRLNGSGESEASLEALRSGQKFRIVNERSGASRPVSAVDARGSMRTNPNEHIEVLNNGRWTRYR